MLSQEKCYTHTFLIQRKLCSIKQISFNYELLLWMYIHNKDIYVIPLTLCKNFFTLYTYSTLGWGGEDSRVPLFLETCWLWGMERTMVVQFRERKLLLAFKTALVTLVNNLCQELDRWSVPLSVLLELSVAFDGINMVSS